MKDAVIWTEGFDHRQREFKMTQLAPPGAYSVPFRAVAFQKKIQKLLSEDDDIQVKP